jgi:hypothetical protein
LLFIKRGRGGSRPSRSGVKFLLAPGLVSLILPLHFRSLLALVFSLKGLIIEKLASFARIGAVNMLAIRSNDPDGPLLGEGGP